MLRDVLLQASGVIDSGTVLGDVILDFTSGNDANDGKTLSKAVKTMRQASQLCPTGGKIYIVPKIYNINVNGPGGRAYWDGWTCNNKTLIVEGNGAFIYISAPNYEGLFAFAGVNDNSVTINNLNICVKTSTGYKYMFENGSTLSNFVCQSGYNYSLRNSLFVNNGRFWTAGGLRTFYNNADTSLLEARDTHGFQSTSIILPNRAAAYRFINCRANQTITGTSGSSGNAILTKPTEAAFVSQYTAGL